MFSAYVLDSIDTVFSIVVIITLIIGGGLLKQLWLFQFHFMEYALKLLYDLCFPKRKAKLLLGDPEAICVPSRV